MITAHRIALPVVEPEADRGIHRQYAIDHAAWLWHPDAAVDDIFVARFTLEVDLPEALHIRLHVSADQRFEWFIDGQRIGMGPDRGDLDHWSFHSYDIELPAGAHEIAADVWWLGELAPVAQHSGRGGFVFAAEDPALADRFNTGVAPWRVRRVQNWAFTTKPMHAYHVIGPQQTIDGTRPRHGEAVEPMTVAPPVNDSPTGVMIDHWRLYPSPLPDMLHQPGPGATPRAAGPGEPDDTTAVRASDTAEDRLRDWRALLEEGQPLTVPAGESRWAVLMLEDYVSGYGAAKLAGDGRVTVEWAEALYEVADGRRTQHKGQRDAVIGKAFFGFGDTFIAGDHQHDFRGHWWRSGRFLRITATAGQQPLTIEKLGCVETRYPIEDESTWASDDAALDGIMPLAVRGMQMCMHETYLDCPYYEQLMYVGDTRLHMLINHAMSEDDRLVRRGIELFDFSRWRTGFVAERYPSSPFQSSQTYAMIWPLMVHDYAQWRDDAAWVQQRVPGMRSLLEHLLPLRTDGGLLGAMPGWSFVDWVTDKHWQNGCPPSAKSGGASSLVNLHLLLALRAASDLETWHGEALMAQRWRDLADALACRIVERFWDEQRGLLLDDDAGHLSEHAQCLALLGDALPQDKRGRAFEALISRDDLSRTTVYFSFYLLETLARFGRGDLLCEKLAFWKALAAQGFKTPAEKPEPSRSDCHAWGSHPLYHAHASLAGIRPDGPGFRRVVCRPCPGTLQQIQCTVPHPRGQVRFSLQPVEDGRAQLTLTLPPQTPGRLIWRDQSWDLDAGETQTVTVNRGSA